MDWFQIGLGFAWQLQEGKKKRIINAESHGVLLKCWCCSTLSRGYMEAVGFLKILFSVLQELSDVLTLLWFSKPQDTLPMAFLWHFLFCWLYQWKYDKKHMLCFGQTPTDQHMLAYPSNMLSFALTGIPLLDNWAKQPHRKTIPCGCVFNVNRIQTLGMTIIFSE